MTLKSQTFYSSHIRTTYAINVRPLHILSRIEKLQPLSICSDISHLASHYVVVEIARFLDNRKITGRQNIRQL